MAHDSKRAQQNVPAQSWASSQEMAPTEGRSDDSASGGGSTSARAVPTRDVTRARPPNLRARERRGGSGESRGLALTTGLTGAEDPGMTRWQLRLGSGAIALASLASTACGGSTEDSASPGGGSGGTGATAGTGGSGGGGATGGNGGCAAYAAQATPAELAKTPRVNATAELLAIETSGSFLADDALYDRLIAELSQIYILDPSVSAISAFSPENNGSLILMFDDPGWTEYQAGSYHAWDCPNQAYGAVDQGGLGSIKATVLDFGGKRMNMLLLSKEYAALANVTAADPNTMGGDASDVCLEIQGDTHYFIFDTAGGDCPAGCTEHYYSAFSAAPGPTVQALGNYDPAVNTVAPKWFDDLTDCRTRL